MQPAYIVKDDRGLSGQSVSLTSGETKGISFFLFNADGSPLFISGTISDILVKIYTSPNAASIHKLLSMSQVTKIADSVLGMFGFAFTLAAADTLLMASNNAGLPVRVTLTMSDGSSIELDFLSIFNVLVPSVQT
jgi:hypothetical protein